MEDELAHGVMSVLAGLRLHESVNMQVIRQMQSKSCVGQCMWWTVVSPCYSQTEV